MTDEKQHMTVYVFFILNGIIDLSLHLKLHKMPNGTDYIASSISWAGFGFLFLSHKHAKTTISIYYHQTLGWLVVAVAVITLMQYKYERNTLIALARGSLCTLTGTWLYQVRYKCCYCNWLWHCNTKYFVILYENYLRQFKVNACFFNSRLHFNFIILSLLQINIEIWDGI